jgi:small subunit ribosomal protein S35
MSVSQDWPSVWPTARVFHPSTVPLPLHMGYIPEDKPRAPPSKFNNPELMKIPNFLHLSPPAIKRHCDALKQFCTQWPKGLETDEKCDKHFPIEIKTQDFVFSNTSIRWADYRIVDLKVKLSALPLDYHAVDKIKRLLMERYDKTTDTITIRASRCPLRKQNYEYAMYLLTAVFFESWVRNCSLISFSGI